MRAVMLRMVQGLAGLTTLPVVVAYRIGRHCHPGEFEPWSIRGGVPARVLSARP